MFDTLSPAGIVGLIVVLIGIALIASENLLIAAGFALVLVGIGLFVRAMITGMLRTWGMA